jgi:hypothetical protein
VEKLWKNRWRELLKDCGKLASGANFDDPPQSFHRIPQLFHSYFLSANL